MKILYRALQLFVVVMGPLFTVRVSIFSFLGIEANLHDMFSLGWALIFICIAIVVFVLEKMINQNEMNDLKVQVAELKAYKESVKYIVDNEVRKANLEVDKKALKHQVKKMKAEKERNEILKEIQLGNKDIVDAATLGSAERIGDINENKNE